MLPIHSTDSWDVPVILDLCGQLDRQLYILMYNI